MKSALRAFKNEWNEYSEGERIVRELTSNDDEKPSVEKLQRLVYLIGAEPENYKQTYMMLMKRVTDYRYLRHTEKGLITVEYLLKYADTRFVRSCKSHVKHFRDLKKYKYVLNDRDYGGNVRHRAARITQLLEDDDELENTRAQAQGLPKKSKKTADSEDASSKKEEKEHSKTSDDSKNIKPSVAKKQKKKQNEEKEKEKEKEEVKKPKEQVAPSEDLLSGFVVSNTTQKDDWLDDFAVDNKQFENGGLGEDGGQFGFGGIEDNDTFFDDNATQKEAKKEAKKEENVDTTDEWMTQLTQLDDPLQTVQKPQKKVNKKGKTMAQMQTNQDGLADTFDDNFLETINSGLTGQPTKTNTQPVSNDPFLSFNNNTFNNQQMTSGYGTSTASNPFATSAPTFATTNTTPLYQATTDPFQGLGGNTFTRTTGPVPATYQKPQAQDPFSDLNWR